MRKGQRPYFAGTRFVWALLASVLLFAACGSKEKKGVQQKPSSRGLPYELVLIIPEPIYNGELKDTLESVLKGSTPVLPQHEPMFRLDVVYADGNLTPWRTFRNRLLVEIDRKTTAPTVGVARDAVARPQLEVKVTAGSVQELAHFIGTQRQRLTDLFVDAELDREAARLRRKYSKMTADSLSLFGHAICVPEGLHSSKRAQDFLWTGTNLNDKDQNFIFYSYPWDGGSLTPAQYVQKRDSVLRINIPGSLANQWMETAREQGRPLILARTRTINNKVVQEIHGLWELHNGALGGAFVALERVDTASSRVLVTEGFIYSPHSPKRNLMRQMEAALRTFK